MSRLYPKTANFVRLASLPLFIVLATNVFGQPVINSFAPASGPVGSTVTLTGRNFSTTSTANVVYFGTSKARVIGGTATSLSVVVPTGASYQPISVTTAGADGVFAGGI